MPFRCAQLLLLTSLVTVLPACNQSTTKESATGNEIEKNEGAATTEKSKEATEVVLVGTHHFLSDMTNGYSPGHLRALLGKIKPDVVAVEAPVNTLDAWQFAPLELQKITKPWCDKHGIPAAPTSWHSALYGQQIGQMVQSIQASGKGGELQRIEQKLQQDIATLQSCEAMNGDKYLEAWREYHSVLNKLYGQETPWEVVNKKMVDEIEKVCDQHPGKRIAVVYGAAHSYFFNDNLANVSSVRILPTADFFPLTSADVDKHTISSDYVLAMRPLNFMQANPMQLQHTRALLEQMKRLPELEHEHLLYSGKQLMHEGKLDAALVELSKVTSISPEHKSSLDGKTCLCDAATIACALVTIKQQKYKEAREYLSKTQNSATATQELKQTAIGFLQSIPR